MQRSASEISPREISISPSDWENPMRLLEIGLSHKKRGDIRIAKKCYEQCEFLLNSFAPGISDDEKRDAIGYCVQASQFYFDINEISKALSIIKNGSILINSIENKDIQRRIRHGHF